MDDKAIGKKARMMIVTQMTAPEGEQTSRKHAGSCLIAEQGNKLTLSWKENGDGQTSEISLCIEGEKAVMHRRGEMDGHLCFVRGERQPGIYHTPYGSFDMVTDTKELTLLREEKGGILRLSYALFVQGGMTGTTAMEIIWRS